jgi:branched-subunit amino acid aminotransferase/4-amino-4-deoxychorismate lyase
MHYYLADRRAAAVEPGARALLLDGDGFVVEASTANVLIFIRDQGLISPPREEILAGISLAQVSELAGKLGLACRERKLTPGDVAGADEVLLTSTPFCLLPATRFNGRLIGGGAPGEVFHRLLDAWSELAGIDVAAQAARFARRAI